MVYIEAPGAQVIISSSDSSLQLTTEGSSMWTRTQLYKGVQYNYGSSDSGVSWTLLNCQADATIQTIFPVLKDLTVTKVMCCDPYVKALTITDTNMNMST